MKKLTSMIDQVSEKSFSEQTIQLTKENLRNILPLNDLKKLKLEYDNKKKNAKFWLFSMIILLIVGVIVLVIASIHTNIPMLISSGVILLGCVPIFIIRSMYSSKATFYESRWVELINSALSNDIKNIEIFRKLIESKYENIKLLGQADEKYYEIAKKSKVIPLTANVDVDYGGLEFLLNNRKISTRSLRWHWETEYKKDGKTIVNHHFKDEFYVISTDLPERFLGFQLELSQLLKVKDARNDLENDFFNKTFDYKYNNPINLRVILTPFAQESFVNNFKMLLPLRGTTFKIKGNSYVISGSYLGKLASLDFKKIDEIDKALDLLVNLLVNNANVILDNFSLVTTMRELVK